MKFSASLVQKKMKWVINLSVACSLWLWSLANQPSTFPSFFLEYYLRSLWLKIVYVLYLLVPGLMTRKFWVVLGQGPIHHVCQCWASRIITATSTCSWALSIASVEDCRWLSDRTSSAPAQWTSQHFEREGRRQHRAQRPWRKLAVSFLVVSIYLSFKAS